MVFKAVSGDNKRVFDTYNSPHTSSEDVMAALDVTNKHTFHYKNRIVLNWGKFGPSEVRHANPGLKKVVLFFCWGEFCW